MLVEFSKTRIAKIRNDAWLANQSLYQSGVNIIKENSDLDADKLADWIMGRQEVACYDNRNC